MSAPDAAVPPRAAADVPLYHVAVSARRVWWLALTLIAYGSLYPLQFAAPAANDWHEFIDSWGARSSLGDILGNIALFVPYGLCGLLALHRHHGMVLRVLLVGVSALAFAAVLQVAQLFIPTRVPTLIDVVWNAMGTGLGIAAGYGLGAHLGRRNLTTSTLPVPGLLVLAWLLIELLPLVPSLDYEALQESFKPLLHNPGWNTVDALLAASSVFAIGHLLLASLPRRNAWPALIVLLVTATLGKVVVLTQALTVPVLIGWGLGVVAVLGCERIDQARRAALVFWTLLTCYTVAALEPFVFSAQPRAFNWVPFADVLRGRMLNNVSALAPRLFVYAVVLWLCSRPRLLATALAVAAWVTLLEITQIWLPGRVATISEPMWVLLVALLMSSLRNAPAVTDARKHTRQRAATTGTTRVVLAAALTTAAFAAALWTIVRLPGVPYNLRELLHGDASAISCVLFALACLWFGAGSVVLAARIRTARAAPLAIGAWAFVVGIASLLLMMLGATDESIRDVAGSNNLYYFVTEYEIWGSVGKAVFEALPGPGFIAFVERPVRYAALFGPLFTALALAHIALTATRAERPRVVWLMVAAIPWLWLCKGIAFDFSSTDNLNELITRPGGFGIGGGGYLYALLATVALVSAALANARGTRGWTLTVSATVVSLPLSWWLINLGLEGTITKYGMTFSGVQFLLGPDRSHLLGTTELAARWTVLYLGALTVFAGGMRLALGFTARTVNVPASRPKAEPISAERGAPTSAAVTVRLARDDVAFIELLAARSARTAAAVVTQIIASQLQEKRPAMLRAELRKPRSARLASDVDHSLSVLLSPADPAVRAVTVLADDAGVSVSRAVRRLVSAFVREMNEGA